jgi:hypothetical protein
MNACPEYRDRRCYKKWVFVIRAAVPKVKRAEE